jgi:tetratricopeptide (TPR) repeat protein
MSAKSVAFLAAAMLAATPIWAQQQGGGGASRGRSGTTTQPTQPTTPSGQRGGQQQQDQRGTFGQQQPQQMPEMQRPIMLSGKVQLDDGNPPPDSVTIYLDCDGQRAPKGYSNLKGHFSVDLSDRNQMAFADASYSGGPMAGNPGGGNRSGPFGNTSLAGRSSGLGRYNLFGCSLLAELAGFVSESIELGSRSVFDNPNIGTIILRRLEGVEGTSISFTSYSAPKKAKKAYEKASKEVRKKKPNFEKARKELDKAVAEHPQFAAAWNLLGKIRLRQNDEAGAQEAFEKAAEADPKYLEPYPHLARMALQGSRWDDAVQLSNHLLRLNPYIAEAHYFQAVAEYNLGRMEAAEKSVTEFQASEKAAMFPQSNQLLGMIYVKRGQYEPAAGAFRAYVTAQPNAPQAADIERQLKEWEALGVIAAQQQANAQAPAAPDAK